MSGLAVDRQVGQDLADHARELEAVAGPRAYQPIPRFIPPISIRSDHPRVRVLGAADKRCCPVRVERAVLDQIPPALEHQMLVGRGVLAVHAIRRELARNGRSIRRRACCAIDRIAKTEAGRRRVEVPELLRPILKTAIPLPGSRYWLRKAVRRLCKAAGVPVISVHGLRGTHASLTATVGVTGQMVAHSLGHTTYATTVALEPAHSAPK